MIVEVMSANLKLSIGYIEKLANSASHLYKEYPIPKKSGGTRIIHHPARELKLLQRWLLRYVLPKLPIHDAASAYRKGQSIRINAQHHVANNYLLRVDFEDFFHCLRGADVERALTTNRNAFGETPLSDYDIELVKDIVCRFDRLTIGAPTSPYLSNAIMFDFDSTWSTRVAAMNVRYSRYADDLYFSTDEPRTLSNVLTELRQYLVQSHIPALTINDRKTAFSSRKYRKLAAGLVLTPDRRVSIGRNKKRALKALVLKLKYRDLNPEEVVHLRGWIAFVRGVEPEFVKRLEDKYGLDLADKTTWA